MVPNLLKIVKDFRELNYYFEYYSNSLIGGIVSYPSFGGIGLNDSSSFSS
jgi:hypothetical protein